MEERFIVHLDMDAFFAAVEQRDEPKYRGKPVIVGSDPKGGKGRGVVATCSYEARQFGIRSAMPISEAFKRCPKGIYVRGSMRKYRQVSREMFQILYEFTPDIQPISIDEAFLDITKSYHLFGTPVETCQKIKKRIFEKLHLTASVGLGPSKMIAKIASELQKPDGLVIVGEKEVRSFLNPLPIQKIWGLGKKTVREMNALGILTIEDLAGFSVGKLERVFGVSGRHYWERAHGLDESAVEEDEGMKSISHERTFSKDVQAPKKLLGGLMYLSEKVSARLRSKQLKAKTISLKIRLKGFKTYNRSKTLVSGTNYVDEIYGEIKRLFEKFYREGMYVRLIGVRCSNLMPSDRQENLFEPLYDGQRERIHEAAGKINDKFGDRAIYHATDLFRKP